MIERITLIITVIILGFHYLPQVMHNWCWAADEAAAAAPAHSQSTSKPCIRGFVGCADCAASDRQAHDGVVA